MKHFFKQHKVQILINLCAIVIVTVMLMVSRVIASPNTSSAASSMSMGVLSYQGTLLDSSDNPVNGDTDMTFRIYNHATDPTSLWEEAHTETNAVPVKDGLFNIMLGSLNPIPDSVWDEAELYLGIQIGNNNEMIPRDKIEVLPLAQMATIAKSVAVDSIFGENIIDGSITQEDAPSLIKSANGQNEIIRSGNNVYMDSDLDGKIEISYPCFPNGVRVFIAQNGHFNANHSQVIGNNGVGRCSTTIIISPVNSDPIRFNWIAIGN